MKLLLIGDVYGSPGLLALRELLPRVIARHAVDLTIANVENVFGGRGVTPELARDVLACQVDLMTSGNHIWTRREILPYLAKEPRLLRPANYPSEDTPGRGRAIVETPDGRKVGVLNLEGRIFNPRSLDCPFRCADRELPALRAETPVIAVDMHGEATSEKGAMGAYLDGRVSVVFGTHTHVQTADERVLPGGTAFITDLGMTGPTDSVIGSRKEVAIERFLTQRPVTFAPAKHGVKLQGAVVDVDDATGRARAIVRISEPLDGRSS